MKMLTTYKKKLLKNLKMQKQSFFAHQYEEISEIKIMFFMR